MPGQPQASFVQRSRVHPDIVRRCRREGGGGRNYPVLGAPTCPVREGRSRRLKMPACPRWEWLEKKTDLRPEPLAEAG